MLDIQCKLCDSPLEFQPFDRGHSLGVTCRECHWAKVYQLYNEDEEKKIRDRF